MANDENLVSISSRPLKEQRAIRSKGGRTRSPKRKWAARLREMRKKGMTDDNYKRMYAIMTENESFVMDSYLRLEKWSKECDNPKDKLLFEKLKVDVLKHLHGKNPQTNVNILNQTQGGKISINIIEHGKQPRNQLDVVNETVDGVQDPPRQDND